MSESIILDIQHTNLSWLFSTLNHTKDATILTALPIICCMLGESVVCKVSGTPQSWCGRPLLMSEKIRIAIQGIHGILVSIIIIVVRLKTSHRDKLMNIVLNGFSVADLMLNVQIGMCASKIEFFNLNHVPHYGQGKYNWCNAAATIQILGLIGYIFLIPCAGFAFIKGMQFGHSWSTILFPSLTILLPSVIAIVLAFEIEISSTIQLQLSTQWMSIVPLGNNYIFLFRKSKALFK